jgi:hypothetical protein
MEGEGLKETG